MVTIAEGRKSKYLVEIRSWNWDRIVSIAKDNAEYDEFSDSNIGSLYLGSILNLFPSGKFYLPFACSNVDPCPHCHGEGYMPNLNSDPELHDEAKKEARKLHVEMTTKYGHYCERRWPAFQRAAIAALDARSEQFKPYVTCPYCGGCGSEEAHLDDLFREALEQVAEDNGGWIGGSEGDGLDVMFNIKCELEPQGDEDAE